MPVKCPGAAVGPGSGSGSHPPRVAVTAFAARMASSSYERSVFLLTRARDRYVASYFNIQFNDTYRTDSGDVRLVCYALDMNELEQLGERIAEQAAHLDAAMHRLLADLREFD